MNYSLGNGTNSPAADILTVVGSINLILGLPINSYAMWLILSGAGGTMASEFFFLNLIVSVLTSPLASVFYLFAYYCNIKMMALTLSALMLFYVSVPSFQCCICVERYIAVVHPVVFLRYKALRYRVACCCVVWPMLLAFSIGSSVDYSSSSIFRTQWSSFVLLGFYIVCISVVSFCCLSVLRALKQPGPGEGQRGSTGEGNNMKSRAFRMILISLIVMVLTIMICIINLLNTLFKLNIPLVYNYVTYALATMTGFVHPLLYIHKTGKLPCFKKL